MPATVPDEGVAGYEGSPIHINGCGGSKNAVFNKDRIRFNGGHPDETRVKDKEGWWQSKNNDNLDHETFYIERKHKVSKDNYDGGGKFLFTFCKTARKPYNIVAQVCMILLKYYFKDLVEVHIDGDPEDWNYAFLLTGSVLPNIREVITMELGNQFKWLTG